MDDIRGAALGLVLGGGCAAEKGLFAESVEVMGGREG